ncbi:DUF1284 domain-containing protein [Methylobrevis pamukkalensis]|uniref:DUF1284 domain-containing protein n=1 Tax=Methylobrevis pamukkalensis TaxID=1439726 RepID=A0A1E3GWS8_9HYPH|nr:DUF1284 domain-containing protein [Methylobrevis pamukkalensis]ODN68500.1 hypothetical protein A6302_04202 [Methylobrevis pamukkalensis]
MTTCNAPDGPGDPPVRLRAHHLLCMLTYVGEGYSPAFVANYDRMVARIAAGAQILIVEGPDDICAPLLGDAEAHCRAASVLARDQRAQQVVAAMTGQDTAPGLRLVPTAGLLARMRAAVARGDGLSACGGCEWADLCARVAAAGYSGARLPAR